MSFTYSAPTGLTGTAAGDTINLIWNPAAVLTSPTVLLLPFTGTNGGTVTTDISPQASSVTINAGTIQTASPPVPGVGSYNVPSADYFGVNPLCIPYTRNGPVDALAAAAWTIEMWVKSTYNASTSLPFRCMGFGEAIALGPGDENGFYIDMTDNGNNTVTMLVTPNVFSGLLLTCTNSVTEGAWFHIAVSMDSSKTGRLFVNGILSASTALGTYTPNTATSPCIIIGSNFATGAMSSGAEVSQVRITNGAALYTANFTPPTTAFPASPPPVGYDIYLGGTSTLVYTGTPGRAISVPGPGTYTFNVAASDGISTDLSAQSNPFTITIGGQGVYKAIMVANPGSINPRIYPPQIDSTVRVTPPRITS